MNWIHRKIESESDSLLSGSLKSDLKRLAESVPEPDFSQVRLQALIQSSGKARVGRWQRASWVLAPVCAAALALVVMPRMMSTVQNQPTTPAHDAPIITPSAQPDATVDLAPAAPTPPIAPLPEVTAMVIEPKATKSVHVPAHRERSARKTTVLSKSLPASTPDQTTAKTIDPSEVAGGADPSQHDTMAMSAASAPTPAETTVEITATQSEHGLSVAREVEMSNDVVIGG